MAEIIEQIKEDTSPAEHKDVRRRYKGICPKCGKEMYICKSIAMEMGINTGSGRCIGCGIFMHIKFNPERQEMDLEPFEDYQKSVEATKYVDKIVGNMGYGGQDNDE